MMGGIDHVWLAVFGIIDMAETLMGGKRKTVGCGYRKTKTWMAGALRRGGKVCLECIPAVTSDKLQSFINRNINDEAKAIYTDEMKGYPGIEDDNTRHETVNHSEEKWVVRDVRTNGIDGVRSLFKRSSIGGLGETKDGKRPSLTCLPETSPSLASALCMQPGIRDPERIQPTTLRDGGKTMHSP